MHFLLYPIFQISDIVLNLIYYVVLIDLILNWLMNFNIVDRGNEIAIKVVRLTNSILYPIYSRIRRVLRPINGLDFSPLVLILAISFAKNLLFSLYKML
ncbi:MAG: YggT family protein [Alphaproteobacteria bacterium]|jgi:YggT family protein|nr:YggT family protein [Alphaproteobacteria bacterium]